MTATHTADRPLEFTDTHRDDEGMQSSILDALEPECACRALPEHEPMCPRDLDPHVCTACDAVYDPTVGYRAEACATDHCDDCALDCHRCTSGSLFPCDPYDE